MLFAGRRRCTFVPIGQVSPRGIGGATSKVANLRTGVPTAQPAPAGTAGVMVKVRGSRRTAVPTGQVTPAGTAGVISKELAPGFTLLSVNGWPRISTVSPFASPAALATVIVVV